MGCVIIDLSVLSYFKNVPFQKSLSIYVFF